MADLIALSDIRRMTKLPAHVINHAIDRYGPAPIGRIGITRVWRREDLPTVLASIAKTARMARPDIGPNSAVHQSFEYKEQQ
jgi:hypothetical protein